VSTVFLRLDPREGELPTVVWLCGVDGFKEKWRTVLGNFESGEVRLRDLPLEKILDLLEKLAIHRHRRTNRIAGGDATGRSHM